MKGESKLKAFPIAWVTSNRRLLIVGGGSETIGRIKHALQFDWASVHVVLPHEPAETIHDSRLRISVRNVEEKDVQETDVVIEDCNKEVAIKLDRWCETHHKIFNAMDKPELCDFYYMSLLFRDPLVLAISSGGDAPALSSALRKWLETHVGPGWSTAARLLAELREQLPGGQARMDVLKKLARDPHLLSLIEANDEAGLRTFIKHEEKLHM